MADYNINLTIQNIWSVFRVVIDIAIMWVVFYYAIKVIRNNSRTIQIFKGIIAVVAAVFYGMLGLYLSAVCRNSYRALIACYLTVVTLAGWCGCRRSC